MPGQKNIKQCVMFLAFEFLVKVTVKLGHCFQLLTLARYGDVTGQFFLRKGIKAKIYDPLYCRFCELLFIVECWTDVLL
jgi:hypothetical protein